MDKLFSHRLRCQEKQRFIVGCSAQEEEEEGDNRRARIREADISRKAHESWGLVEG